MPYITKQERKQLNRIIKSVVEKLDANESGKLNYVITKLIIGYMNKQSISYAVFNEVIGVLECVKTEFYRRTIVPYEETKIRMNGDVY